MENIYTHIAATLKGLRKARGWSLDKTAQETGVSKAMLGQIEREESSPTIATLWKIANGFNTSFSSFISDVVSDTGEPIQSVYGSQTLYPGDSKINVVPLFSFDDQLHCEIFVITLLPGCEHVSLPHKPGVVEHVIVVEGAIEVLVNDGWKLLHKNEGIRFNANQPHGYRNTTADVACFHDIIHYPPS